jgi:hypothetical protein
MGLETLKTKNWKEKHIPLADRDVNFGEAYDAMTSDGAEQGAIPFIVQLVENPKYQHWWNPFHGTGAVNLENHDYIHLLLGRGMLPKDEAFVIGFTMGSTNIMTTWKKKMFLWVSQYFYPKHYQFTEEEKNVYFDAGKLGFVSDCTPLHTVDMNKLRHLTIAEARKELNLTENLLHGYYEIEAHRYPDCKSSQRILNGYAK